MSLVNKNVTPEIIKGMLENGLTDAAKILVDQSKIDLPPWPEFVKAGFILMPAEAKSWLAKFITTDPDMLKLKSDVEILAMHPDTVLVTGESGTGKELLARALQGNRRGAFVALNCAGMPEHLIESELFGHVAGAFTDAKLTKTGLMREAQDGTLFLDEIGDLHINVQAKLLRAIQEMTIRPVGSNKELPITCRIVCATHHNLWSLVQEQKFRLDLYARLSMFELQTKPLRSRLNDIMPIVQSLEKGERCTKVFQPIYTKLAYPLNVRSLQQYVRRLIVLNEIPRSI